MSALLSTLNDWVEKGAIRPLDYALTRFIDEQLDHASDPVLLATALLSEANGHGHVCLDLQPVLKHPGSYLKAQYHPQPTSDEQGIGEQLAALVQDWSLEHWVEALRASEAVSTQTDDRANRQTDPNAASPLVLAGTAERPLLYLRRYWQYECAIHQGIEQRLRTPSAWDAPAIRPLLDQLFPSAPTTTEAATNWQKIACALAVRAGFAIITGGPGTGKTTTVMALLALLQGLQQQAAQAPLTMHLTAPTGKAAARLSDSLADSLQRLALDGPLADIQNAIPTQATTLHRLLGSQPGTRHFRHHAGNPLSADVVVVDEASMVDVEMLAKLLDALPATSRLVLIGDKDQLASVEAGSVLGDLSLQAHGGHYTRATAAWLQTATGESLPPALINDQGRDLAQATTLLRHSYRFAQYPGIGELAGLVNAGNTSIDTLKATFKRYARQSNAAITPTQNLQLIQLPRSAQSSADHSAATPQAPLKALLRNGYRGFLEVVLNDNPARAGTPTREALDAWALAVFACHRQFQLLTATRQGPWGVEALNALTVRALADIDSIQPMLPSDQAQWYSGRPVLITRNDYNLQLMNGDMGICLAWPALDARDHKRLRVAFPDGNGGVRWILPSRLQDVETVFAMTVHKSQGSEFAHTALVLPEHHNPVLTKELLYTGITRSSQAFTLVYSGDEALRKTLSQQVERASGLRYAPAAD